MTLTWFLLAAATVLVVSINVYAWRHQREWHPHGGKMRRRLRQFREMTKAEIEQNNSKQAW